jgi:Lamin-B receptor of TUDOR domain
VDAVGRSVKVYWPGEKAWFTGDVAQFDAATDRHLIAYEDGDEEWLKLAAEKVEFLEGALAGRRGRRRSNSPHFVGRGLGAEAHCRRRCFDRCRIFGCCSAARAHHRLPPHSLPDIPHWAKSLIRLPLLAPQPVRQPPSILACSSGQRHALSLTPMSSAKKGAKWGAAAVRAPGLTAQKKKAAAKRRSRTVLSESDEDDGGGGEPDAMDVDSESEWDGADGASAPDDDSDSEVDLESEGGSDDEAPAAARRPPAAQSAKRKARCAAIKPSVPLLCHPSMQSLP